MLTVVLYFYLGFSPLLFIVLILAPDLAMLGYLGGPRVGAVCYNIMHTHIGPALLALFWIVAGNDWMLAVGLIWLAHIFGDRALGYGLKYGTGFKDTHLGRIGG